MTGLKIEGAAASTAYRVARSAGLDGLTVATTPTGVPAGDARPQSLDLIDAIARTPQPIDARKVQVIRDLIGSGAYPIDAHAIAARMIALDLH